MAKIFLNPGHCIGIDSGAVNPVNGAEEAKFVHCLYPVSRYRLAMPILQSR